MAQLAGGLFAGAAEPLDSAAAFLLVRPPQRQVAVTVDDATIETRPGCAHVTARFNGARDPETAYDRGHAVVQKGLDLMSAAGRADLLTRDTVDEYVVSWRQADRQIVRLATTTFTRATVGEVRVIRRDAEGNEIPAQDAPPQYHIAYRYFRVSQCADDLYEAYRNMYLAFERLLSSRFPKGPTEREVVWLQRALRDAEPTLNLRRFYPAPPPDIAADVTDRIYNRGRLPLFHAAGGGRAILPPYESQQDRDIVSDALGILTRVVLAMAERWHDTHRRGGGVFHGWVYANIRAMLERARAFAFTDTEPFNPEQRDLTSPRYATAVPLDTRLDDDPVEARAPVLWGSADYARLGLAPITKIEIVDDDAPLIRHTLDSTLGFQQADAFEFRMAMRVENTTESRSRFIR